ILADKARREQERRRIDRVNRQVEALHASLKTIADPLREQLLEERLRNLEESVRAPVLQAVAAPKEKHPPDHAALLKANAESVEISDDDLAQRFPEYSAVREQIKKAVAAREKERSVLLPQLSVLFDNDLNPPAHHILLRGQHNAPGKEVQPGVPA